MALEDLEPLDPEDGAWESFFADFEDVCAEAEQTRNAVNSTEIFIEFGIDKS